MKPYQEAYGGKKGIDIVELYLWLGPYDVW